MNEARPLLLHVSGAKACFRRPEFSTDFVSYDVLPPLTAQRMVNGAYPLTDASWQVRKLTVLKHVHFGWDRLITARGERRALLLLDVAYLIELAVTGSAVAAEEARRRLSDDQPEQGHLGLPEFGAELTPVAAGDVPRSALGGTGVRDLGWMPDRTIDGKRSYLRTVMIDGVIDLTRQDRDFRAI